VCGAKPESRGMKTPATIALSVHQRRLRFEQGGDESAAGFELERAIVADPRHPEADLVQVRMNTTTGLP